MKINNWPLLMIFFLEIGCHSRLMKPNLGLLAGCGELILSHKKTKPSIPKE